MAFREMGVMAEAPVAGAAVCAMAEPPVGTRVPIVVPETKVPGLTPRTRAGTQWRDRAGFSPDFRHTLVMSPRPYPLDTAHRHAPYKWPEEPGCHGVLGRAATVPGVEGGYDGTGDVDLTGDERGAARGQVRR
ncbi:hypothetical protein GCM10010527_16970 [Streptomyces drozdowiczii]